MPRAAPLHGQASAEVDDGGLRRVVVGLEQSAVDDRPGHGGDVDDRAAAVSSMARPSAWQDRKTPVTLMSITRCHWPRGMFSAGAALAMPALLTARVSGPSRLCVCWTACGQAGGVGDVAGERDRRLPQPGCLRRPAPGRARAGRSRRRRRRRSASPRAIARPIPLAAPVTSGAVGRVGSSE